MLCNHHRMTMSRRLAGPCQLLPAVLLAVVATMAGVACAGGESVSISEETGGILSEDDRIPQTALTQLSAAVNGCEAGLLVVGRAAGDTSESTLTCEVDGKKLDFGMVFCDGDDWVLARRPGMSTDVSTCPF